MENKTEIKNKVRKIKDKEYKIKPDEYYKNFKAKHPEKSEKIICEHCYGEYNYFSQYMHKKSKRHQRAIQKKNPVPPPSSELTECLITDTEKSTDVL